MRDCVSFSGRHSKCLLDFGTKLRMADVMVIISDSYFYSPSSFLSAWIMLTRGKKCTFGSAFLKLFDPRGFPGDRNRFSHWHSFTSLTFSAHIVRHFSG
jgi:hypothetical protein